MQVSDFKNKKVLVMGLGVLGGGLATTKWLVKHGAKVTVTDLKTKQELAPSIRKLGKLAKRIKFTLGRHLISDFQQNEIIVVNPGVPKESKYLKIAKKNGAQLENEASIFFRVCRNPIIAVTGTRGKTTTVNWIFHLLKTKYKKTVLTGNSSDNPMLGVLDGLDGKNPVVVELSSWQLELLPRSNRAPHIAVITNIYRDHMNRYKTMRAYALAKANISKNQNKNDYLILNKNNQWTNFFLKLKPKSKTLYFQDNKITSKSFQKEFGAVYGKHNLDNLNIALLVAKLTGVSNNVIKRAIKELPQVKFRQEEIIKNKKFRVINDSTATSPDATIAAIKRFASPPAGGEVILITGGTDKNLEFGEWAKVVKKHIRPENLYLLNGSATKKIIKELQKIKYFKKEKPQLFENLSVLLKTMKLKVKIYKPPIIILFSPSSTSFEKFKNEFDRGEKFNLYSKSVLQK